MNYLEWNDVIAKHFFNSSMARKEVLLYVNEPIINSLGKPFGGDINSFLEAVKCGPVWITRQGFCQKAFQAYDGWRNRSFQYPPYIAYLACFVLAATLEGSWAPQAYYPRLIKLLNEPNQQGRFPSISLMEKLWEDLERWCNEDKKEEFGRFVKRIRTRWCDVGLPWSQTIISNEERKNLSKIFFEAGFDPTDAPSPDILLRLLRKFGQKVLEKRTFRLLSGTEDIDKVLRNALLSLILEELEQWDGSIPQQFISSEEVNTGTEVKLRLCLKICLKIDNFNKQVSSYFRVKTKQPFPEEGPNFELPGDTHSWSCGEKIGEWSGRLRDASGQKPVVFDASKIDWTNGVVFYDRKNQWEARLKGETTRLFVSGGDESLPDCIEINRLDRGIKFYVCSYGENIQKVKEWGEAHCSKFEQMETANLPTGWVLFSGENASAPCQDIDVLCLSSLLRLKLKGIKIDTPNVYLKIKPPEIVVENGSGNEKIIINGIEINQHKSGSPIWRIPKDAPVNQKISIEVVDGNQGDNKILFLQDPDLPHTFDQTLFLNKSGEIINRESTLPKVSGAILYSEEKILPYPTTLPTHLSERIIFLGEKLGEIKDWPREPLPSEWQPVWALARTGKKGWQVHYCGNPEHLINQPNLQSPCNDRSAKKKWKEAIWVNRKTTKGPLLPQLRSIWKRYVEAAHNV